MPWLGEVPAVLAAWYPGQRGGEAIARILFGEVNPSGRLPLTFPASDAQAPRARAPGLAEMRARDAAKAAGDEQARIAPFAAEYVEGANAGYRWFETTGSTPLFPFGFGLTYTSFDYHEARVIDGAVPMVELTVTNNGPRAGVDIPQIYVRAADGAGRETWRLAGFARLELDPGVSRRVTIDLEPRTFARWDVTQGCWRIEPGEYVVAVGRSAVDLALVGSLDGTKTSI